MKGSSSTFYYFKTLLCFFSFFFSKKQRGIAVPFLGQVLRRVKGFPLKKGAVFAQGFTASPPSNTHHFPPPCFPPALLTFALALKHLQQLLDALVPGLQSLLLGVDPGLQFLSGEEGLDEFLRASNHATICGGD